MDSAFLRIFLL
jgi:hypothetical protein